MSRPYQKYSPEFREEVAEMVIETSRSMAEMGREYGIKETTVCNWVRAYREKHGEIEEPLTLSARARLAELERKNRELEMKCAFLTKAAAYLQRSIGKGQVRVYRCGVRRRGRGHGHDGSHHHPDVRMAGGIEIRILRMAG